MNKYKLKLKTLRKKTLIQLIKRLRKEVARLNGALDRITESQDRLQEKYKDLQGTHELLQEEFAAVTDGMSGQEIAVNSEANTPGETVELSQIKTGDRFRILFTGEPPFLPVPWSTEFYCRENGVWELGGTVSEEGCLTMSETGTWIGSIITDAKDAINDGFVELQWKGPKQVGMWNLGNLFAVILPSKEDS